MKNIFTTKIFNILFLIIVILLPMQTRYFLMIQNINHNFFEYGSISLYIIDVLIALFIIYGIFYSIKNKVLIDKKSKIFLFLLFLFNLSIFSSIFFSSEKIIAIYNLLKIFLFSTFSFIIFINKIKLEWFTNSFILSSSIQGFISIYQFIMQSVSANKYLGVSEQLSFNLGTYVIEGSFGRILKSYGLFPHPNMLGLFLLIGLVFILFKIIDHKKEKNLLETSRIDFKMIYLVYAFGINFIGLIFTFSRIAIFIFIFSFILFLIYELSIYIANRTALNKRSNYSLSIFMVLIFIILSVSLPSSDLLASRADINNRLVVKSTNERLIQLKDFKNYIQQKYLTGLGVGNYTIYKHNQNKDLNTWDLQPVHNMYLLIFLETGIFGLLTFISLIAFKLIRNKEIKIIIPFVIILLFGLLDHFIITLTFGLIIFFLLLGLETDKNKEYNKV